MEGSLLTFGNWLQNRSFALAVAGSDWAYPFAQATHFTGLSLWIGTTFAVDLSLLGIGNEYQTTSQLSDFLFMWNWIGFCIAVVGGFPAFLMCSGDLCHQRGISHKARFSDSGRTLIARCDSAKSESVGSTCGSATRRQNRGVPRTAILAFRRQRGCRHPLCGLNQQVSFRRNGSSGVKLICIVRQCAVP